MAQDLSSTPEQVAREAAASPPVLGPAEQAAIAYARDHPEAYGRKWRKKEFRWTVVNVESVEEGNSRITLTYRPTAGFRGRPGEENIVVAPNGDVVSREQVRLPREAFPWPLFGVAAASVVAAVVLVPMILTGESRAVDPLYVAGRYLWMRVTKPDVVDAVYYVNDDISGKRTNWAITPEDPNNKLAIVTVRLINQLTNATVVVIDENAAKLVAKSGESIKPVNTVERSVAVEALNPGLVQPGFVPLWTTVTIGAGEQVVGQMVFEVPAGTDFKEFRWEASDAMTARYR